jgi:hypothetical protein
MPVPRALAPASLAGAGFAVGNLFGGEDAADEASTEALDGSADARNLDEVGAEAEDHGCNGNSRKLYTLKLYLDSY